MMRLAVNTRVTAFATGGQQRVAAEVLKRLGAVLTIAPSRPLAGAKGHLWEQTVLPWRARGRLLWSPSATGPVFMRRQVVTLHDVAFLDTPEYFSTSFRTFYAALIPRLVRTAARVVTVSEFSRRRILDQLGARPERVVVIGNGVSENFRPQSAENIARTRAALDLPPRYFLLQATSDRRKNLAGALQAWKMALPGLPDDLQLVVSGNLDRAHVFGKSDPAVAAPRTRGIGYVAEEHMAPLMAGAEAFLFPSLYEGFGMPIIEAMACGTPVLTSAATATQEVAQDKALLVNPASIADIARGIIELSGNADLRARLSADGLAHGAKFNWEDIGQRYIQLFEEVERETLGRIAGAVARPASVDVSRRL
jgi:glycosyltransferase involved in cell wall biosynthesis